MVYLVRVVERKKNYCPTSILLYPVLVVKWEIDMKLACALFFQCGFLFLSHSRVCVYYVKLFISTHSIKVFV